MSASVHVCMYLYMYIHTCIHIYILSCIFSRLQLFKHVLEIFLTIFNKITNGHVLINQGS